MDEDWGRQYRNVFFSVEKCFRWKRWHFRQSSTIPLVADYEKTQRNSGLIDSCTKGIVTKGIGTEGISTKGIVAKGIGYKRKRIQKVSDTKGTGNKRYREQKVSDTKGIGNGEQKVSAPAKSTTFFRYKKSITFSDIWWVASDPWWLASDPWGSTSDLKGLAGDPGGGVTSLPRMRLGRNMRGGYPWG